MSDKINPAHVTHAYALGQLAKCNGGLALPINHYGEDGHLKITFVGATASMWERTARDIIRVIGNHKRGETIKRTRYSGQPLQTSRRQPIIKPGGQLL